MKHCNMKIFLINNKSFLLIVLSLFLLSCSTSKPIKTHYYLLHNQQINEIHNTDKNLDTQPILVVVNELPRYLSQTNLVMLLDQHQLYYAHNHKWAEPLYSGVTKALISDLNKFDSDRFFFAEDKSFQAQAMTRLIIDISHFHVTDNSQVTLSAYYWLANRSHQLPLNKQRFYLHTELTEDGYSHAVETMRALVSVFAEEILDKLKTDLPLSKNSI